MKSTPPAIRLQNLTLGYDRHPAVHHLSGLFAPGSMTALIGPNGSGKSTLLKGLCGFLKPYGGRIDRDGLAVTRIAYLPQQADVDREFPITVLDTVAMGLWRRLGMFGGLSRSDRQAVQDALAAVGLTGFEDRAVGKLSGGQFQRVLFARLLLQDCPVILLDEPFTAIDSRTTDDLLQIMLRWSQEGRTLIAALHDYDQVRSHFPQTLFLAREAIGWGPTETVLTPENLARARRMAEAWNETAPECPAEDPA